MKFCVSDFQGDTAVRLGVITAFKCGLPPLTHFKDAPSKPKFNRILNEYVNSLGEDWESVIIRDCNTILNEEVLNETFNPATYQVSGLSTTKTILMTPEQYEIDKENPAFQADQGFNIEIVEKPEMFFSPNNIENEPELSQDSKTRGECEETIPLQLSIGSKQQPEEFEC